MSTVQPCPPFSAVSSSQVFIDSSTVIGDGLEFDVREADDAYRGDGTTTEIDMSTGSAAILSSGNPLPAPKSITPAELLDDAVAEAHEGSLLLLSGLSLGEELEHGEWTAVSQDGTPVRVDGAFVALADLPLVSAGVFNLVGLLHYSYGEFKMEPRDASDVSAGR